MISEKEKERTKQPYALFFSAAAEQLQRFTETTSESVYDYSFAATALQSSRMVSAGWAKRKETYRKESEADGKK